MLCIHCLNSHWLHSWYSLLIANNLPLKISKCGSLCKLHWHICKLRLTLAWYYLYYSLWLVLIYCCLLLIWHLLLLRNCLNITVALGIMRKYRLWWIKCLSLLLRLLWLLSKNLSILRSWLINFFNDLIISSCRS